MAFSGGFRERIAERLGQSEISDLQQRVVALENRVGSQDTEITGLNSTISQLRSDNTTLKQQISDIIQGRVSAIFYDIEAGGLISKVDFDAWRTTFQTSLNQTLQTLDGSISSRIQNALNQYTSYIYTTPLFDDGFAGTLLSVKEIATNAGRFKQPFVGSTAPFRTWFNNIYSPFDTFRQRFDGIQGVMDGLRTNFDNIGAGVQAVRQDIHSLKDAFQYTRDAAVWLRARTAGLSPNVADVADTYRSIFEYLRSGGSWYAHAEGGIPFAAMDFGPVTFNGTSTYFDAMKSNFLQGRDRFGTLKDHFTEMKSASGTLRDLTGTLTNSVRPRLGW